MIVFILILILIYFIKKKNNRIDPNYKVEMTNEAIKCTKFPISQIFIEQ